jgi:hypothetical protein
VAVDPPASDESHVPCPASVLQRRTLREDGGFSFRARIIPNAAATHPLRAEEATAFEIDDP